MSYREAVEVLRERATILDYTSLDRFGNDLLDASTAGIIHGVRNIFHFLAFYYLFVCFWLCRGIIQYVSYAKQFFFCLLGGIQLLVPNPNGVEEKVILCTTVWTDNTRMREAYTISHYKEPVFFVMSPKIVDVLLDINIFEKEM